MEDKKCEESHWIKIPWSDVQKGQKVWLVGTHVGQFRAYGPHTVHDVQTRRLISGTPGPFHNSIFSNPREDLLIPKEHKIFDIDYNQMEIVILQVLQTEKAENEKEGL